jgi:hypothetical protein
MAAVDQKFVLERAKAWAEEDGFAWHLDYGALHRHLRPLSEARRQLYLERARDELEAPEAQS